MVFVNTLLRLRWRGVWFLCCSCDDLGGVWEYLCRFYSHRQGIYLALLCAWNWSQPSDILILFPQQP